MKKNYYESFTKFSVVIVVFLFSIIPSLTSAAGEFDKGMVSFSFDDGTQSIYDAVAPTVNGGQNLLNNFKSTQFIISAAMGCASGGVGCVDFMTETEVKNLYNAGHEIANHTRTDPCNPENNCPTGVGLAGLPYKDLLSEIDGMRLDLLGSIGIPVSTLAFPNGTYNDDLIAKIKSAGIVGSRTVEAISDVGQILLNDKTSDRYKLSAAQVNIDTPITSTDPLPVGWQVNWGTVESWIDSAISQKKWLVLVFHEVKADCGTESYCVTPAKLSQIVSYVESKGTDIDVVTVKDGLSRMDNHPTHNVNAPVINVTEEVSGSVKVATSSPSGANVIFTATVTDDDAGLPGALDAFCTIPTLTYPVLTGHPVWGVNFPTVVTSGTLFPVGTTTVTCKVADTGGVIGTKTFDVVVSSDTQGPVFSGMPSTTTVYTNSVDGSIFDYTAPTATDNGSSVAVSCSPSSGTLFPVGTTTVNCSASDLVGNTSTGTFGVGVIYVPSSPTATTTVDILPSTLPNVTLGNFYSQTLTASTTAFGPFVWEVIGGALPPGTGINPTSGVIAGTPTNTGTSTFTVFVTNGVASTTKEYEVVVNDAPAVVVPPPPASSGNGGGSSSGGGGGGGPIAPIGYLSSGQVLGASTTTTSTMSIDELKSKLALLYKLLFSLQLKVASCDYTFNNDLNEGMNGVDVKNLQTVLNMSTLTRVASTGMGSSGNETEFFRTGTKNAVIKFQTLFVDEIGVVDGVLGSTSRATLNKLCSAN